MRTLCLVTIAALAGAASAQFRAEPRLTSNPLDVVIEGRGFFHIELPDGQSAYTRDGRLRLNPEGLIVTRDGFPLVPLITVPADYAMLRIEPNGHVAVVLSNSAENIAIGDIQLARFMNPDGLRTFLGQSYVMETEESGPPSVGTPGQDGLGTLASGFVEDREEGVPRPAGNHVDRLHAWAEEAIGSIRAEQREAIEQLDKHMDQLHVWADKAIGDLRVKQDEARKFIEQRMEEMWERLGDGLADRQPRLFEDDDAPELEQTVTLVFAIDGNELAISTATRAFRLETQREFREDPKEGEEPNVEEFTVLIEGTVSPRPADGRFLVQCSGIIDRHCGETGSMESVNIQFETSAMIKPGEKQVLVDQDGNTIALTLEARP